MKEKLQKFMVGRYGFDAFSKVMLWVTIGIMLISIVSKSSVFYILSLLLIGYTYYRAFSRNIQKRYEENQKFLNLKNQITMKWNQMKLKMEQKKTHRFYHCPSCKQTVRVPKGKGRICITCPKCKTEFIKKS